MARLSRDEAMRLQDRFEEFIQEGVGQDYVVERYNGKFCVQFLGAKKRTPRPRDTGRPLEFRGNVADEH